MTDATAPARKPRKVKITAVRKRGARKDGHNYVGQCTVCSGSKADFTGVAGVSKETADRMAQSHCDTYHGGNTHL